MSVPTWRSLVYLFAWVGMDAEKFLSSEPPRNKPRPAEWGQAALRFVAGLGLLGFVVPVVAAESGYLAAWIGLVGLVLVLHFGLSTCWPWDGKLPVCRPGRSCRGRWRPSRLESSGPPLEFRLPAGVARFCLRAVVAERRPGIG